MADDYDFSKSDAEFRRQFDAFSGKAGPKPKPKIESQIFNTHSFANAPFEEPIEATTDSIETWARQAMLFKEEILGDVKLTTHHRNTTEYVHVPSRHTVKFVAHECLANSFKIGMRTGKASLLEEPDGSVKLWINEEPRPCPTLAIELHTYEAMGIAKDELAICCWYTNQGPGVIEKDWKQGPTLGLGQYIWMRHGSMGNSTNHGESWTWEGGDFIRGAMKNLSICPPPKIAHASFTAAMDEESAKTAKELSKLLVKDSEISTAAGANLDSIGLDNFIARKPGETDAQLRERIKDKVIGPKRHTR